MRYRIQLEPSADFETSCDQLDQLGFKIVQRIPANNRLTVEGPSHSAEQLVKLTCIHTISPVKEIPISA